MLLPNFVQPLGLAADALFAEIALEPGNATPALFFHHAPRLRPGLRRVLAVGVAVFDLVLVIPISRKIALKLAHMYHERHSQRYM